MNTAVFIKTKRTMNLNKGKSNVEGINTQGKYQNLILIVLIVKTECCCNEGRCIFNSNFIAFLTTKIGFIQYHPYS